MKKLRQYLLNKTSDSAIPFRDKVIYNDVLAFIDECMVTDEDYKDYTIRCRTNNKIPLSYQSWKGNHYE